MNPRLGFFHNCQLCVSRFHSYLCIMIIVCGDNLAMKSHVKKSFRLTKAIFEDNRHE